MTGAIVALFVFDFGDWFAGFDSQGPLPVVVATPTPLPADTPTPADTPQPPQSPPPPSLPADELVGFWELESDSGIELLFFLLSDYIMFIDFGGGDREVHASQDWSTGAWYVDSDGYLHVDADYGVSYIFVYQVVGDRLTLIDEYNDASIYIRTE